jgi:DNA-binding NtrC family response regulator
MDGYTVLLVDDESVYSNSLEGALSVYDVTIRRANDNDSALMEIQTRRVDVVILDVTVPEIDGIELLKQIKTTDPLVEVILLADQVDLPVAIQGLELGAFDFLFKSIEIDELVNKLKDASEKKTIQEKKIIEARNTIEKNHKN